MLSVGLSLGLGCPLGPAGELRPGAVTIMRMSLSDVGWYQCYTNVDDETYSSIGYFLNVKPADHFEEENSGDEDNTNQSYKSYKKVM